jgi:hypothetical protein
VTLLVPAYGALLLVAAEGGRNRLLWAVAVGISITQAAVLTLVLRPAALPPASPFVGVIPPLLATLAIRATLVRRASLGTRWATAGVAWLATLGPLVLWL